MIIRRMGQPEMQIRTNGIEGTDPQTLEMLRYYRSLPKHHRPAFARYLQDIVEGVPWGEAIYRFQIARGHTEDAARAAAGRAMYDVAAMAQRERKATRARLFLVPPSDELG
jgi:hypothetical protein